MLENWLKKIVIGDCKCFKGFIKEEEIIAHYCQKYQTIFLHKRATENIIENVINHEILHEVLSRTVGKHESTMFDNLARYEEDIEENGCVKEC